MSNLPMIVDNLSENKLILLIKVPKWNDVVKRDDAQLLKPNPKFEYYYDRQQEILGDRSRFPDTENKVSWLYAYLRDKLSEGKIPQKFKPTISKIQLPMENYSSYKKVVKGNGKEHLKTIVEKRDPMTCFYVVEFPVQIISFIEQKFANEWRTESIVQQLKDLQAKKGESFDQFIDNWAKSLLSEKNITIEVKK